MKKEFNNLKVINNLKVTSLSENIYADGTRLLVEDVKEFIRLLKESMDSMFHYKGEFLKHKHIEIIIDKLAGEKLK